MPRPDQEPGFWNEYQPPKSEVGALLQRPAIDINAESLASAYMADYRRTKRSKTDATVPR